MQAQFAPIFRLPMDRGKNAETIWLHCGKLGFAKSIPLVIYTAYFLACDLSHLYETSRFDKIRLPENPMFT
jgi:hypothetical protein